MPGRTKTRRLKPGRSPALASANCSETGDKLNRLVALHVMKWTPKIQGHAKVTGWYDGERYKGIELPAWAWSIYDAILLLDGRCFTLWTCDAGYGCELHTAPEKGEETLARCFGDSLPAAICRAVVTAATESPNSD